MPANWMHYLFHSFVDLKVEEIDNIVGYLEGSGLMPIKYGFSVTRPKYVYNTARKNDVVKLCLDKGYATIKGNGFIVEVAVSEQYKNRIHNLLISS